MPLIPTIQELNRRILSHMDDHGLRTIVIYMSDIRNDPTLRYDNLGDSFGDRAINLIQYCRDNRCMGQLIDLLKSNNPVVLSVQQPPPDPAWDEWAQQRDSVTLQADNPSLPPSPDIANSPTLPAAATSPLPEGINQFDLQQAATVANGLGIYGEVADLYIRGLALGNRGRFAEMISYCQQAIAASEKRGDHNSSCHIMGDLARAYARLGQHAQALTSYQQAINAAMQIGNARAAGMALFEMGNTYTALGQHPQAVASFDQAQALFTQMGDLPSASQCYMQAMIIRQSRGHW